MKVTVADSLFLQYARSIKLGGGNENVTPTHFEWELADPERARFVTDSHIKDARGPGQVALLLESFFLHPENYLSAMEKPFEAVLTHNSYFAKHKNWLWFPHGGSFVPLDQWKVHKKTKGVSLLCSPKRSLWGHRKYHYLAERFGDHLDVYGLDGHVDKLTAIAPYRYTVVVEAEETVDFFSEKLIDCLALGTIPIYWGCPNIGDYFDVHGLVRVNSTEEVAEALGKLNTKFYSARKDVIGENLEIARRYAIPEDWIWNEYPQLFEAR